MKNAMSSASRRQRFHLIALAVLFTLLLASAPTPAVAEHASWQRSHARRSLDARTHQGQRRYPDASPIPVMPGVAGIERDLKVLERRGPTTQSQDAGAYFNRFLCASLKYSRFDSHPNFFSLTYTATFHATISVSFANSPLFLLFVRGLNRREFELSPFVTLPLSHRSWRFINICIRRNDSRTCSLHPSFGIAPNRTGPSIHLVLHLSLFTASLTSY